MDNGWWLSKTLSLPSLQRRERENNLSFCGKFPLCGPDACKVKFFNDKNHYRVIGASRNWTKDLLVFPQHSSPVNTSKMTNLYTNMSFWHFLKKMCSHALESKKLNISILMKFRGSRVTRSMKNTVHIPRIYTNLLVSPVSFVTWLRQSVLRCILSYAEKHYGHLWERFPLKFKSCHTLHNWDQ